MKHKIKNVTFRGCAELADRVQAWIEEQDSPISVRRVFYAMVVAEVVKNVLAEYQRISKVTLDLRHGGRVDWSMITDSTRGVYKTNSYVSARQCAAAAVNRFRLDRWADQEYHVEVWVEKRGLIPALYPVTNALDVYICENGGKRALTEESVASLIQAQEAGKENAIVYVGDYDSSGLQMDENMIKQLNEWGVIAEWWRVALTLEQTESLPRAYTVLDKASSKWVAKHPNVEILKRTDNGRQAWVNKLEKDSNAEWFKSNHDGELFQVEVDALEIGTLRQYVQTAIEEYMDAGAYASVLAEEDRQREDMRLRLT